MKKTGQQILGVAAPLAVAASLIVNHYVSEDYDFLKGFLIGAGIAGSLYILVQLGLRNKKRNA